MRFYEIALCLLSVKASYAYELPSWHPPGPDDVRAPCPMLNTLANHGYLPHDGKDITVNKTVDALGSALNFDAELAEYLFSFALTTNPTPNATTFSLNDLGNHNILEHDGSLSRADYYWSSDATSFNQTVFDETRSYWTGPVIDMKMAETARLARIHTSNVTNPTFSLSPLGAAFSLGESAAYIFVLGDIPSMTVPRNLVEYFFENERLPTQLGWKKPETNITSDLLFEMMDRLNNSTQSSTK